MKQKIIFILIMIFFGINIIHSTEWTVGYRIFWMDNYEEITNGKTKVFDNNQNLNDELIRVKVYSEFGFDTRYGQKLVSGSYPNYVRTQKLEITSIKKVEPTNGRPDYYNQRDRYKPIDRRR